jgi:flagella basal body P-ring formation protein FlgA
MRTNWFPSAILVAALASTSLAQDVIRLRPQARVKDDVPVRLADVAEVNAPSLPKIGETILLDDPSGSGTTSRIDVAFVRDALKKAGINLGRVVLSGPPCELLDDAKPTLVDKVDLDTPDPKGTVSSLVASEVAQPSVRAAVGAKLADLYDVDPQDLRLTFDKSAEDFLSRSTRGLQLTVQPAASGKRIPVSVRLFDRDRLVATSVVRVGMEIRRDVVTTLVPLAKGNTISGDQIRIDQQWLTPDLRPAPYEEVVGCTVLKRIGAGEVIDLGHIKAPSCVLKGDIVRVDCLSGGISVQAQGRALEDGREGQLIKFQSMYSRKVFKARIAGPGYAVMTSAGSDPEQK